MKYVMGLTFCAGMAWGAFAAATLEGWTLGKYTTRVGDIVTVDIPQGKIDSGAATCAYDFSKFDGKCFRASVKARGAGVFRPQTSYLGFKFMATYRDDLTKELNYPGAAQLGGDFPWQTVTFADTRTDARRQPGTLTLGLQSGYGRVEFDLSTLVVEEMPPLWPETNATHRCVYTPRVTGAPRRRGVMLGHGLKEDDFKVLHDWGVTLARFQMTRDWNTVGGNRDLADYDRYIDGELESLEHHLVWAKKYGIQIVVDLHAAPGSRHLACHDLYMCHDAKYAEAFLATWRKIATRFRGRPEIYGFDLVNEPQQVTPALPGCDYWSIQSRAAEAIRAIDPETPIIIESNCYDGPATFSYLKPLALTNIIYQVHMYVPMQFTHQCVFDRKGARTSYPDAAKGWNIDLIRRTMKPVIDFQNRHGAKIYVGEFSAIVWGAGAADYIRDCIEVFEENRWDWTFHAFREWDGWSVEHEADAPWKQRPSQDNPRKRALLDGFRRGAK
ncbi:MAG: glycoside hydrolase family 5 protein [Kiritimatiellia bacterium]